MSLIKISCLSSITHSIDHLTLAKILLKIWDDHQYIDINTPHSYEKRNNR